MAARENGFFWKEIVGTLIWIALLTWLFHSEGIEQCREWWGQFQAWMLKVKTTFLDEADRLL